MPAKYSHVKKRSASGLLKKEKNSPNGHHIVKASSHPHPPHSSSHHHHSSSHSSSTHTSTTPYPPRLSLPPHAEQRLTTALTAVSHLERSISRLLLLRYDQDIARLFSTHLHRVAMVHLPAFVIRVASVAGPGWLAWNIGNGNGNGQGIGGEVSTTTFKIPMNVVDPGEAVRDWLRTLIGMDLREVGERVATKSVLWSYTALREFAISNNIPICSKTGLHSLRLLPHYPALKAHVEALEKEVKGGGLKLAKPPHLSSLDETYRALEEA
ncbi:hypothetical protein CVT24_006988, partial [Panaeolus cyanescens]